MSFAIPALSGLPENFSTRVIATGILSPIRMVFSPAGDLYVCERAGRLRAYTAASSYSAVVTTLTLVEPALDLTGERGLLAVAFHPDLTDIVYISYTNKAPDGTSRNVIASFVFDPVTLLARLETEIRIFSHDPLGALVHNAGPLFFAGTDDAGFPTLFASHGENSVPASSQVLTTTHGKVLRMRSDGSPAAGNPFLGRGLDAAHETIYALGLRNPFAVLAAPDPPSASYVGPPLIASDVGDWHVEEVNVLRSGFNGGWPLCEGTICTPVPPTEGIYAAPIFGYVHFDGAAPIGDPIDAVIGCAITSAAVYAPPPVPLDTGAYPAAFTDALFVADFCSGWLIALPMGRGSPFQVSGGVATGPGAIFARGLTEGTVGLAVGPPATGPALFILSRGPTQVDDGSIIAITFAASGPPVLFLQPAATLILNPNQQTELSIGASGAAPITFQWQTYVIDRWIDIAGQTGSIWSPSPVSWAALGDTLRCVASNALGSVTSRVTAVTISEALPPIITITAPLPPYASYAAAQILRYSAVASAGATIAWTTRFNHGAHFHTLGAASRGAIFEFIVPSVGEESTNVSISVSATAFDATSGLSTTSPPITLHPLLGAFRVLTQPLSLGVDTLFLLDGSAMPAGEIIGVAGMLRQVTAPARTIELSSGNVWLLRGWSDGNFGDSATRSLETPHSLTPLILSAIYENGVVGLHSTPSVTAVPFKISFKDSTPSVTVVPFKISFTELQPVDNSNQYVYYGLGGLGGIVFIAVAVSVRAKWKERRASAPPPPPLPRRRPVYIPGPGSPVRLRSPVIARVV